MKTAIVVGGTSGIGKEIAINLLKKDYYVYIIGRDNNKIEAMRRELANDDIRGYKYHLLQKDIECPYASTVLTDYINKNIDVIIWCAGKTDRTPFGQIQIEEWKSVFDTSVHSPFFFIQAIKNKINKDGRIIFISSILGIEAKSRSISYGVSRAAINMMVPYLAKEFSDKQITVNAIAPGFINTDWHTSKTPEQIKQIENECLAKRLGTTKEVADLTMGIINNSFINGQIIRIDGGYGI